MPATTEVKEEVGDLVLLESVCCSDRASSDLLEDVRMINVRNDIIIRLNSFI